MMTIKARTQGTVAWTAQCPITFVDLDTPRAPRFEGQKPRYQCILLIDKGDTDTLAAIEAAVREAQAKLTDTDPGTPFEPLLKDGDERTGRDGEPVSSFHGKWYFTPRSETKPVLQILTDRGPRPADPGEITNWAAGQAVILFAAYDFNGHKGVSARMLGFCKTGSAAAADTPPIDPADMFSHLAPDPFAAAQTAGDPFAAFQGNTTL